MGSRTARSRPRPVRVSSGQDALGDLVWAAALGTAAVLVVAMLLLAAPLGDAVLGGSTARFFPSLSAQVYPKHAETTRYLLAVAGALGLAIAVARARAPAGSEPTRLLRAVSVAAKLGVIAVAAWAWVGQYHGALNQAFPRSHLPPIDLVYAALTAATAFALARVRPVWFAARSTRLPRRWWFWLAAAVALTACWVTPGLFRAQSLGHAIDPSDLMFTFNDGFLAPLAGRTPLVNYNPQYTMLLGAIAQPVFELLGAKVGAYSGLMCLLSLGALIAVQRTLAIATRNEPLALALYVPWLAISLYTVLQAGNERFTFGTYYAVFPLRYGGPYLLLYLCARHLSGRRPRSRRLLFLIAGLVAVNNLDFGLPALGALLAAVLAATPRGRFARGALARDVSLGLGGMIALLVIFALVRAGGLPDFGLLLRYPLLYGTAGFNDLPTPTAGLHLIMYMTFGAALLTAALRWRRGAADHAFTGLLAYGGVFGLGAGAYYLGRSHPDVQIAIFSAWGLSIVLLALPALRAAAGAPRPFDHWFAVIAPLFLLGLITTAVVQFPAPWQQLRRIEADAPSLPADRSAAVAFVKRTARPGEQLVVLDSLSFLIARDAHVTNVTPYGESSGIVSYNQLDDVLAALRRTGGKRLYVAVYLDYPGGPRPAYPEFAATLTQRGFSKISYDPASELTEWQAR